MDGGLTEHVANVGGSTLRVACGGAVYCGLRGCGVGGLVGLVAWAAGAGPGRCAAAVPGVLV